MQHVRARALTPIAFFFAFLLILSLAAPLVVEASQPATNQNTANTIVQPKELPWWKTTSRDLNRNQIEDRLEEQEGPFRGLFVVFDTYPGYRHQSSLQALGLEVEFVDGGINTILTGEATFEQVQAAIRLPHVVFVEEEQLFYPFLDISLGALKVRETDEYSPVAWDEFEDGDDAGTNINIAILDTGVDDDHDFLLDSYIAGVDYTDTNPFAPRDGSADPDDNNGHGTHVASTALGWDPNDGDYHGVAPQARLVDVKVMTDVGVGGNILQGLNWSLDHKDDDWEDDGPDNNGVQVVSISAGTSGASDGTDAVSQKANELVANGIVVVAAMGNDGQEEVPSPAAGDWVIAVANMDDGNTVDREDDAINQGSSNRGPRTDDGDDETWDELKPDISSSGTDIDAAQHTLGSDGAGNSNAVSKTGTSMATPHVSGLVALLLQSEPDLTPGPGTNPVMWRLRNMSQLWGEPSFPELSERYNNWSGHGYMDSYDIIHTEAPDAVITTAWADPVEAIEGDSITLYATIENQGNIDLDSARLEFYNGPATSGDRIVSRSVGGLTPGETVTLSLVWSDPDLGNHSVEALLSEAEPQERSTRNNNATFNVIINEPPQVPDLRVEAVEISDETPSEDQQVTITARIANVGLEDVTSYALDIMVWRAGQGETNIKTHLMEDLEAGNHIDVHTPWEAKKGDDQRLIARLNDIQPEDATSSNNERYLEIDVAGRPPEPDLTVSVYDISMEPELPENGETVTFTIILHNIGGQDGTADVDFDLDGDLLHRFQDQEVESASTLELEHEWVAESGDHELEVKIGQVSPEEASNDNNLALFNFLVLEGGPDFSLEKIDLPGRLVAGEPANLRAQIKNRGDSTGNVTATFFVDGTNIGEQEVNDLKKGRSKTLTQLWTPVMNSDQLRVVLSGNRDLNPDNDMLETDLVVEEPYRIYFEEPMVFVENGRASLFTVAIENRGSLTGAGNIAINGLGFPGNLTFTDEDSQDLEVSLGGYEVRYLNLEAELPNSSPAGNYTFQVAATFTTWSDQVQGALVLPLTVKPLEVEMVQGQSAELVALLYNPLPTSLAFDLRVEDLPRGVSLFVNDRDGAALVSVDGQRQGNADLELVLSSNARVGEHDVTLFMTSHNQEHFFTATFQLNILKLKEDDEGLLPGFSMMLFGLALMVALVVTHRRK